MSSAATESRRAGPVRRAWVLNFDADMELARPLGYAPPQRMLARSESLVEQLGGLVPAGDIVLSLRGGGIATGLPAIAWCPTPRALRLIEEAGAYTQPTPPLVVLQRANHRAFCAELGQMLPAAQYLTSRADVDALLRLPAPNGWLLKRPFSISGSGRRHILEFKHHDHEWITASLAKDGLQMEPLVERLLDVVLHGFVHSSGQRWLAPPLEQCCDARGRWLSSIPLTSGRLDADEAECFRDSADRVADALHASGYFGPFGVDGFRYRYGGDVHFNPRCEINARYTMGWALGMAELRPDLVNDATP